MTDALVLAGGDLATISAALGDCGFTVVPPPSLAQALKSLERVSFNLVVVSLELAGAPDAIAALAQARPDIPVIAVASPGGHELAARALRKGAFEWLEKPLVPGEIGPALERVVSLAQAVRPPGSSASGTVLRGSSTQLGKVRMDIARFAAADQPLLILGETGTGKELVARSLHEQSTRAKEPFVAVSLAALPGTLLESELFGYARGAFTGALHDKLGRAEAARKGTLFLDEIGDVSLADQVKLLRLVQEGTFERLGENRARKLEARIVAATHRNLANMVDQGTFREDLYYRLNVATVHLPPLRGRSSDVVELAEWFVEELGKRPAAQGYRKVKLAQSAIEALVKQPWPGNVRQLLNLLERLVLGARGPALTADDVLGEIQEHALFVSCTSGFSAVRHLSEEELRAARRAIEKALNYTGGNKTKAAELLGIGVHTLYDRFKKLGVSA